MAAGNLFFLLPALQGPEVGPEHGGLRQAFRKAPGVGGEATGFGEGPSLAHSCSRRHVDGHDNHLNSFLSSLTTTLGAKPSPASLWVSVNSSVVPNMALVSKTFPFPIWPEEE